MLSKETARCFSPPSDIAPASLSPIQPITQSVHIPGSVTGHVGGGGTDNGRKCGFAGDSEQQAYLRFRIWPLQPAWRHTSSSQKIFDLQHQFVVTQMYKGH